MVNTVAEWIERTFGAQCHGFDSLDGQQGFFLEGGVRSLVQAGHELPKHSTDLATTIVVFTKESSSIS